MFYGNIRHNKGKESEKKMDNNEKNIFLGEITSHLSGHATTPSRPKKRYGRFARMIGFGGGSLGLLKGLIVLTVTAALISTMIGSYLVSQTDDIALEGRLSYDLWIDGVPVGADDFIMAPDTFTDDILSWDEGQEVFIHEFYSPPDNGNFSITADVETWQPWLYPVPQESHEFFGYEFKLLNETDDEITEFLVITGEPARQIKFVHQIDVHFAQTPNPLPYALTFEVTEYNGPIVPMDDEMTLAYNAYGDKDITLNDFDPEGEPIVIVTFTNNAPTYMEITKLDDQTLRVHSLWSGSAVDRTVSITVSDGVNPPVSETLTVHLTP